MFRKMPFILLALMIVIGLLHPWIPEDVQSILYGISLSIKSLIVFSLPFIIFGLLFKTTAGFARNASKMVFAILIAICLSNFLSTMISYSMGRIAYTFDLTMPFPGAGDELQPSWIFILPRLIGNDHAMLAALILGIVLGWWKPSWAALIATKMDLIPATVNVHLIGDCFAIPIFAFAVMKSFGVAEPHFLSYLIFACYFVLAKFSVAAVPGGGILVMLPILERYLGFDATMLSLITALYILFDPIITCANVFGNGGFAMGLSRISLVRRKIV
ncbi:MAG: cation:dicarboxylase symporter family transporter [Chlamydiales bacterium]|nr:cation:dicarboxylase symporter family transporter [Chlamydiales bacterium]